MDLKEEDILGAEIASHWYYVAKGRALQAFLRGFQSEDVLDVGAGSGVFARQLIDAQVCKRATCVDPGYQKEYVEPYGQGQLTFVRSVDRTRQNLVLMMDVLEHVDDDVGLLSSYASTMTPQARILITVPAFQFLWSGHDDFLEHRRRYTREMLETTVTKAGLVVERTRYFFGLLFPLVSAMRIGQRWRSRGAETQPRSALQKHSRATNSALVWIHEIERRLVFPWNRFAGLTVFCLARSK
jgi:hypothetical protein